MGVADALAAMEMEYGSPEALEFLETIARLMAEESHQASIKLGLERGIPEGCVDVGRRNIAVLTVAPTGTTSNIMSCSGGIEPFFALKYTRRVGGEKVDLVEPVVRDVFYREGYELSDEELAALFTKTGTEVDLEGTEYEYLIPLLRTSNNINWEKHVLTQAAIQRGFDFGDLKIGNAISKTINLPRGSTPDDVLKAYRLAHREGCKGITVYVDGSYENQVLSTGTTEATPANPVHAPDDESIDLWNNSDGVDSRIGSTEIPLPPQGYVRPTRLYGYTDRVRLSDSSGDEQTYLTTVNLDAQTNQPIEVIVVAGKGGSRSHGEAEAIGRLVSLGLQSGVEPEKICNSLSGIDSGLFGSYDKSFVKSPADLVGTILRSSINVEEPAREEFRGKRCPECGGDFTRKEGCLQCEECGFSKCG